jgi:hypothetical protein
MIKSGKMGLAGACGMYGMRRDAYKGLFGKREGKRLEDTIKMDI